MATASSQPWPGLAPEQQKLLLAALASNKKRRTDSNNFSTVSPTTNGVVNGAADNTTTDSVNPAIFSSNSTDPFAMNSAAPSAFDLGLSDSTFDVDFNASLADLSDPFPDYTNGQVDGEQGEQGEKRKISDDDDDDDAEEPDSDKRRDSDSKEAKKPGRKLLTSEPTTVSPVPSSSLRRRSLTSIQKRKAQNRAAQRAFRERKEKHLKDLETKVTDLEKASESANHENSVLRAQVERLQDELKDYRRRLSLTGNGMNTSPPSARQSLDNDQSFGGASLDFNFDFDFPKFGGVPGSVLPSTQAVGKTPQQSSTSPFSSYDGSTNGFTPPHQGSVSSISNGNAPTQASTSNGDGNYNKQSPFGGQMFGTGFFNVMDGNTTASPQPLNNSSITNNFSDMSRNSPAQSNSTSSRSPESQNGNGPSSSCCTSPDPADWSNFLKSNESANQRTGTDSTSLATQTNTPGLSNSKTPNSDAFSLDFLANQNGGNFDPVLFGDYRETQNAIVGDDTFSGGFFEDGMTFPDFNDPFNFNLSTDSTVPAPAPTNGALKQVQQERSQGKKPNLLDQVAKNQEGDYAGENEKNLMMPNSTDDYKTERTPNLMTCHRIWYGP